MTLGRKAEGIARYEAGEQVDDLAAALGVSPATVYRWIRESGANHRATPAVQRARRKLTREWMEGASAAGWTMTEAARAANVAVATVRWRATLWGIEFERGAGGAYADPDPAAVRATYEAGHTLAETAVAHEIGIKRAREAIRSAGGTIRRGAPRR